jgi:hypothetical protein
LRTTVLKIRGSDILCRRSVPSWKSNERVAGGEAREPRLGLSAAPALVSCPYSPECVEVEFYEVHLQNSA